MSITPDLIIASLRSAEAAKSFAIFVSLLSMRTTTSFLSSAEWNTRALVRPAAALCNSRVSKVDRHMA